MGRLFVLIVLSLVCIPSFGNNALLQGGAAPQTTKVAPRMPGDHHPDSVVTHQRLRDHHPDSVVTHQRPRDHHPDSVMDCSDIKNVNHSSCKSGKQETVSKEDKNKRRDDGKSGTEDDDTKDIVADNDEVPAGPTGPTAACKAAVEKTNSCSQAPQVNTGVSSRGNILGNYDAVTEAMRGGAQRLSQFTSQCQSLMSQCLNQCSGDNRFDTHLKSQCSKYQGQVSQASTQSQNLNAISLQTEQAAASIRSGESGFKQDLKIGQGIGIVGDNRPQSIKGGVKPVAGDKLLSSVEMQPYDQFAEDSPEGKEDKAKEDDPSKKKFKQPTYVAATVNPLQRPGSVDPLPAQQSGFEKLETEEIASSMGKEFYGIKKSQLKRKKLFLGSSFSKSKSKEVRKSKSGLVLPKEIIKQQWESQQRELASKEGKTRKDQFIFNSICLRYNNFERKLRIDGSYSCPPAH